MPHLRATVGTEPRDAFRKYIHTASRNMYFVLSALLLLSSDFVRQFLEEVIGAQFVPYLVDSPVAFLFALLIGAKCLFVLKNLVCGSRKKNTNGDRSDNAEQERMMNTEHCILVDEDDNVIGHDSKKNCHLMANGLKLHRAFSVFLFDSKNRLLLQKRSLDKITFPDYWANTCCSHPLFVEGEKDGVQGVKNAARRKLQQELGITPEQIPLDSMTFLTRVHYRASCKYAPTLAMPFCSFHTSNNEPYLHFNRFFLRRLSCLPQATTRNGASMRWITSSFAGRQRTWYLT